jgi:hypothetical protein
MLGAMIDRPPAGLRTRSCLTVFWFRQVCTSKKTVKNTVNLSGYHKFKLLEALLNLFVIQLIMRSDG